jgi:2-polyprenyl-6-hydroxyphenyl methylase/3-demethylubiquinone-9 3-methyltransferase
MATASLVAQHSTIDPDEVDQFSRISDAWWDAEGDFRPLHRLNPARIAFIRDHLIGHFGRKADLTPFDGLDLLDIGCGGGLITEPMARLGATVTGVDASPQNIDVATAHAAQSGLAIDYRCDTAEALAAEGRQFDVVLALEIIEHVADRALFVASCAALVKPGGVLILSTLNRTIKSLALGIVAAEYILRWVPRGTHDWRKFVRPHELAADLRANGLVLRDLAGLDFDPKTAGWRLAPRPSVNYLMFATKPTGRMK